jgi:hypothetical protein
MQMYGNKIMLTTYVDKELFDIIEAERLKTGESQSGMIYSILEMVFRPVEASQ